jgi:peptide/nickel transport system ATP-binding protein
VTSAPMLDSVSARDAASALVVDGLEVQFATDRGWATVVDDVSFSVAARETVGLVGESGSGKSVTCLAAMGLVPTPPGRITRGSIVLEGVELLRLPKRRLEDIRGDEIAMIFQEPMTSLNPAFTVGDQIAETVRRHRSVSRRKARARAVEMLSLVGIPNAERRVRSYPHEFSGGMRQRVMIAMALSCDPKVLIADEPTTALDVTIQAQVVELLRATQREFGMALLLVTHDLGVVADLCDRVLVMYAGQLVEEAPIHELYARPQHPYTSALLASMPQLGSVSERLAAIPGVTPPPWAMPPGCRFHPRCPYAREKCTVAPIPLLDVGPLRQSRCIRVDEIELKGTE